MNLLAHAYLSFNQPEILVGNMISDHVKGKRQYDYAQEIQRGIALHRAIDSYTDEHQATREIKLFFRPFYGLYAAPFSDIVYDHFLANDPNEFRDEQTLFNFTRSTYNELSKHTALFPDRFKYMFSHMQAQNWLFNYRFDDGIAKSFEGLVRRAAYMNNHHEAVSIFKKNKAAMRACYESFFPGLKKFAIEVLANSKI